jgi:hypothetical protein
MPRRCTRPSEYRPGLRSGVRWVVVAAVAVLLLAPGATMASGTSSAAGRGPSTVATVATSTPEVTFPTPIRHVITVLLENEDGSSVLQQGPFEKYLASKYAYASDYYAVCHPSAPNYLSITSGASYQCGSDNYSVYSATNIADLVQGAGLTWGAYMESMPTACDTSNVGNYAVRHDPFLYYSDIVSNASRCNSHVQNFTAWNATVSSGAIPNYVFITPNLLDDGHNTNVSYADAWLKGWLSPLMNDSFFASSVFFITYDESGGTTTGYNGLDGGEVYLAAVGPDVKANYTFATESSHFNLLTTTEWLLGLGNTGHNDSGSAYPPMTSMFHLSPTYAVSGTVTATDSAPIAGATVRVAGGAATATNASGGYLLPLPNGAYNLSASAPGYLSATASLTVAGAGAQLNFTLSPGGGMVREFAVTGTVTNASSGALLAGANVTLTNATGTLSQETGSAGTFGFAVQNGSYQLSASDPGFGPRSVALTVNGQAVVQNFSLSPPAYALDGLVYSTATGGPLVGANVSLGGGPSETTGPSGSFSFDVPNGTYTIKVVVPGFAPTWVNVTVDGQGVVEQVPIAPLSTSSAPGPLAGITSSGWLLIAGIAAATALGIAVMFRVGRRRTGR